MPGQNPVTGSTQSAFPWLGAGIGAATGIINSLFQGIGNRRQNKRMVDFWNMNNAYNHPAEQMKRLQEAGLNPNLMYGQGTVGNSSGAPKPVREFTPNIGNPLQMGMDYKRFQLTNDNLRAMNTNMLNDAALKSANTLKALAESNIKGLEGKKLQRTLEDQIMKIQSEANMTFNRAEWEFQNMDSKRLDPQQRQILRNSYFKGLLADFAKKGTDATNAEKLGILRDSQNKLQALQIDWYTSKAFMGILRQLLGVVPGIR